MTVAQMRALHAAAHWAIDEEVDDLNAHMCRFAGPRWRTDLRKALAEVSRELAKASFTKRRG
jgi:hypothetical protein